MSTKPVVDTSVAIAAMPQSSRQATISGGRPSPSPTSIQKTNWYDGEQLIAAQNAAMECHRRAMIGEQTLEGRRENLAQANELARTFTLLVDALNRYRGKGQQKVTVEHVHVHPGGQAVVGLVEAPGGGDRPKSEEQPHAIAHEPQPAMWSPNAQRETVPIARDAERSLPDAREAVSGRAEAK